MPFSLLSSGHSSGVSLHQEMEGGLRIYLLAPGYTVLSALPKSQVFTG
jgi:hypothetical protein